MYKNLKTFRNSIGMTQKEFAKSLSIGVTTYNGYETGARDPKSDFWIAVARKYGVTIDYLMGFTDNPHPEKANKNSPSTDESVPRDEQEREIMNLVGKMSSEQKDFFLALLQTTVARNQGTPVAAQESVDEVALKAEPHNLTR